MPDDPQDNPQALKSPNEPPGSDVKGPVAPKPEAKAEEPAVEESHAGDSDPDELEEKIAEAEDDDEVDQKKPSSKKKKR